MKTNYTFDESKVTNSIEVLSPEYSAQVINTLNGTNYRKLSPEVVTKYASAMESGNFPFTGDTIKFDWNGNLMDGQHRLSAIAKVGIPQKMIVVRGLDPKIAVYLDGGRKRSIQDAAKHNYKDYASGAMATVKAYMSLKKQNTQIGQSYTNSRNYEFDVYNNYGEDPAGFDEAAKYGSLMAKRSRGAMTQSHISAIYYYLTNEMGWEKDYVKTFFNNIVSSGRTDNNIWSRSYDYLEKAKTENKRDSAKVIEAYIDCFNSVVNGNARNIKSYGKWFLSPSVVGK